MKESELRSSLIIAGMHRSNTSVVSQSLQAAGLFLGGDLIDADASNPHGHFESGAIVDFHIKSIKDLQLTSWWNIIDSAKAKKYARSTQFHDRARHLLDDHFARSFFGWKDPRSAFFLEGWHKVLPDPHYLIVVRHPVQSVHSLIRRSMLSKRIKYRPLLATRYFNLWQATNSCLLEFIDAHPDKCVVLHVPDDLYDARKTEQVNRKVRDEWKLPLKEINFSRYYDPKLIHSAHPPVYLKIMYQVRREIKRIYNALVQQSQNHGI